MTNIVLSSAALLSGSPADEQTIAVDLSNPVFRRMTRITKLAYSSGIAALEKLKFAYSFQNQIVAGESQDETAHYFPQPSRTGLIVGTAYGSLQIANDYLEQFLKFGESGASPLKFSGSIHNSIAAQLAILFNIQGPTCTVSTMDDTFSGSMMLAMNWIKQDRADHILLLIGDEISDYHKYAATHLRDHLALTQKVQVSCDHLVEGFAAFVLSKKECVRSYLRDISEFHPGRDSQPRPVMATTNALEFAKSVLT